MYIVVCEYKYTTPAVYRYNDRLEAEGAVYRLFVSDEVIRITSYLFEYETSTISYEIESISRDGTEI